MIQRLIVRPPAVDDVVEAGAWYETHYSATASAAS